ncbi:LON peptidase substrate-binding domain-containing protein [Pirellulaceae bacterium]|nr:LON peptidase substrate-binding domain-containing protein [Pirellulaceae bacterium]
MTKQTRIVPLFPLADVILFPGQILPLHVFEPRYRKMTHDLLDGSGEFVIGTVLEDGQQLLGDVAPTQEIAGLGRLERYEKLDDGRYMIVIVGQSRVKANPIKSEKPYPMAEITQLDDHSDVDPDTIADLKHILAEKQDQEIPNAATVVQLIDILIMTTQLEPAQRYNFFSEIDLNKRAKKIVDAYKGKSNDTL